MGKHKQSGFSRWWYLIGFFVAINGINFAYYAVFVDKDAWPSYGRFIDSQCKDFQSEEECDNRLAAEASEQRRIRELERASAEEARAAAEDALAAAESEADKKEFMTPCMSDPEFLTCYVSRANCRQQTESRLQGIRRANPDFNAYQVNMEYCESLYPRWRMKQFGL